MDNIAGDAEMSTLRVGIFVATMTGLAEVCAEEVQAALGTRGFDATIALMDVAGISDIEGADMIVVVSSTYGHGDVPDNGQAFFQEVEALPDLSRKQFAVFGLGDRTYSDTFCHAGEKWDALLAAKGATRLIPLKRHDASSGTLAEDVAGEWAVGWAHLLRNAA